MDDTPLPAPGATPGATPDAMPGPVPGAISSTTLGTVAARLAAVQDRVAAATVAAGRPIGSVQLVAVSKFHPVAAIEEALAAGQAVFGENRVQEAASKFPSLRPGHPTLQLHVIGSLQTNKARDAVRLADVIEVLDRPRLADAVAAAAQAEGRLPALLVQVNTGDETQKGGVSMAEADRFIAACMARFGAALQGLMCIPPNACDPRPHFRVLAGLAARHGLGTLSMGMSADYPDAIREGSTHVRVGTAIFGTRV